MEKQYHELHAPHGEAELFLPASPPEMRSFFAKCMHTLEFQTAMSERAQVHLCHKWAQEYYEGEQPISYQNIADFFGLVKSTVEYHLSRPFDIFEGCKRGRIGRPPLLSDEELQELRNYITERFSNRVPCTYEEILEHMEEEFGRLLNIKTLRNFISQSLEFKSVTGVPLEDLRLFSRTEDIDKYFNKLTEILSVGKIPAAFLINVDESGFNEYVDARKSVRIVPASYDQNSIPVPITRTEKRATLIAAICADGSALRPMVIVPRDTIEQELLLLGYTTDKVQFGRSEKGFVNTRLFNEWGRSTLVPEIESRRLRHGYDGPAVLIFDGFGCHLNSTFMELAENAGIICVQLPAHTSDQLQPCDLGIFANQKHWQSRVHVAANWSRQTKQLVRMIDSFRLATTPKNIVSAFRKSGIVTFLDQTNLTLMVRVDRLAATAVRGSNGLELREDEGGKRRIRI